MRIVALKHPFDFGDGLAELSLDHLKRIVVLAGPNGSGKTRLLRRIHALHFTGWEHYQHPALKAIREQWLTRQADQSTGGRVNLATQAIVIDANLGDQTIATEIRPLLFGVEIQPALGETPKARLRLGPLKVSPTTFEAASDVSPVDVVRFAGDPLSGEIGKTCLPYIQLNAASSTVAELSALVRLFLGADLDLEGSRPLLFGQPLDSSGFSEGQQILLQWAVLLHALDLEWDGDVYTLDEPENYLHPKAVVDVLERLLEKNKRGQFWIATHSLSLAAWLFAYRRDELSLYFMSEGQAYSLHREPRRWEEMSNALLGGSKNVGPLREFLDYPGALAATVFAAECLLPSAPVSGGRKDDPQANVVRQSLPKKAGPCKVIDFGAGEGRMLECFLHDHGPEQLQTRLDYYACDRNDSATCRTHLIRIYGTAEGRFVNSMDQLAGKHPLGSFDVCVMCNVLHEIDPLEWPSLFSRSGSLLPLLHDDGVLILIEDYQMPRGEHSHQFGFIVLETLAVKTLFGDKKGPGCITVCDALPPYTGRIKAHSIPARLLRKVTTATRKAALKVSEHHAQEQIKAIRTQSTTEGTFALGQRYAYWVQQLANIHHALRSLG